MTTVRAPIGQKRGPDRFISTWFTTNRHESSDLDAPLEENKQLRELVVQLSEIVVRNFLDRPLLPPRLVEG